MLFLLSPPRFGSRDAPDASSIHARGKVEGVAQSWVIGRREVDERQKATFFPIPARLGYASMTFTCENVFSGRKYLLYSHR